MSNFFFFFNLFYIFDSLVKDMDNVSPEKNDVKSCPRDSGYDSLSNKLSILDKLLHTHPVWLQLGLNDAEAMEILQAQPPGVRSYISVYLMQVFKSKQTKPPPTKKTPTNHQPVSHSQLDCDPLPGLIRWVTSLGSSGAEN